MRAVRRAFRRSCRGSAAYPIQPISSNAAAMKKRGTKTGSRRYGTNGSTGSGRPRRSITP